MEALYNILSDSDIEYIQSQEPVINAYNQIVANERNSINFTIQINDSILVAINSHFGLNLSTYQIPMKWIKGDTLPHIDRGASEFEHTYLLYLTESPGSFIINNETFPITKNSGFKFNEGLSHSTINTGSEPRLLLGPMNEFAQPVGDNHIYYYSSEEDIFTSGISENYSSIELRVGSYDGITSWVISKRGNNNHSGIVNEGDYLLNNGDYYLYPATEPNVKIFYFDTEIDALNKNYNLLLGISTTYTIYNNSPGFYWQICINSTGTDRGIYNYEDTLANNGIYYVYLSYYNQIKIYYFPNEFSALTKDYNSLIATSTELILEENGHSVWYISRNSTTEMAGTLTYNSEIPLTLDGGIYYLYPYISGSEQYKVFYFYSYVDAANYNYPQSFNQSYSYIIQNQSGITTWEIYEPSGGQTTGTIVNTSNDTELTNVGIYHLYPTNQFGALYYYNNADDAVALNYNYFKINYNMNGTEPIPFVLDSYETINIWTISSSSYGTDRGTFAAGTTLNNEDGLYALYPALVPCFLEGTQVLCLVDNVEKWLSIQSLGPDTIVKTYKHGPKKISLLGQSTIYNQSNDLRIKDRLYKCPVANYPELNQDLYITGCHSLLVDNLTDIQRKETIEKLNKIYITDDKYRLIACVDSKAEPWNKSGRFNIYHLALEHNDDGMNYGIYVNGGLLVETCAIRTLKNKSNMKLLF